MTGKPHAVIAAIVNDWMSAPSNSIVPLGIVFCVGVANGQPCYIVAGGLAYALVTDGTAMTSL